MREGMKRIIMARLRQSNLRWLVRQAGKYLAIPYALRCQDGRAPVGPLMGSIFVTYRCNSCCGMCSLAARHTPGELSEAEMIGVIDDLVRIGVSGIGFTGGETLLREDIFRLIRHTRAQGLPVTLNTNAILLTRSEKVEELVNSGVTNVNISLDGASAETHDRVRGGAGIFAKTMAGMTALTTAIRQAGAATTVTVVTVISRDNEAELEQIAELAARSGADQIGFMPLHHFDGGRIRLEPMAGGAEIVRRLQRIGRDILPLENSAEYLTYLTRAFAGEPFPSRCNAGQTSLFIDPCGKLSPCLGFFQLGRWYGDLRAGDTIPELWRSERYRAVRQETIRCRQCYLNCQAELNLLWPGWLR